MVYHASVTSTQPFITALRQLRRVIVTTHVRPDGDALGTVAALALGMKQKGIDSTIVLLSRLPSKYAFVLTENGLSHVDAADGLPASIDLNDHDGLVVADTGTWSQLPGLREHFEAWPKPKLVLDHHLTQENWATVKLVDTTASAAGEVALEMLRDWGVNIDRPIASALYVALVSDTGWFQFSNTSAQTLRHAADLMDIGVDTDHLNRLLNQSERAERVALQTRALQSLQLLAGNRLAVMSVSRDDFEQTRANVPDTENLINIPLQIKTVEVSVLLTEPKDGIGPIRVSLRSKGGLDCSRFAEQFQGGGHARAAGLRVEGTLAHARETVVSALLSRLSA